jgi:hypothetical protein
MSLKEDHEAAAKALAALEGCLEVPSVENAIELLAHASSCEKCGVFLAENPGCAEALIESTHPHAELTPSAEEMIATTQNEFLVFGDAVFERLRKGKRWVDTFAERLSMELPLERRTDLWTLKEVETPRLRCALASAESVRAIGSYLTGGRRKPVVGSLIVNSDGEQPSRLAFLRLNKDRVIPGGYFAERIATYALVSKEPLHPTLEIVTSWLGALSLMMWNAVAETAISGGLGLPELFSVRMSQTEIAVSLSAEPFKESKFASGMSAQD